MSSHAPGFSDWKPIDTNDYSILHLSDLHFGSDQADPTWATVADFIQTKVKPALILVTGDLVHSPKEESFRTARDSLDALQIPYFVCPGNHDRHRLGNNWTSLARTGVGRVVAAVLMALAIHFLISAYARWYGPLRRPGWLWAGPMLALVGVWATAPALSRAISGLFNLGVSSLFDRYFRQRMLSAAEVTPYAVGAGADSWELSLLALDSCVSPDFLARGFVETDESQGVVSACRAPLVRGRKNECDVSFLLVHHHLLSIRALESKRQGSLADLLNATCMVNAGSVLESLSEGRIDLVLHGHEHESNVGAYRSLETGYGQVHVLGVGSATGNSSLGGCDVERSSCSIVLLKGDRSVRLRNAVFRDGAWKQERAGDTLLMSAEAVRQARLRRVVLTTRPDDSDAEVTSEITRHYEFTREHDILVSTTMTDWIYQTELAEHAVWNSTGDPIDPEVHLFGPDGHRDGIEPTFTRDRKEDHAWTFKFGVPGELIGKRIKVLIRFVWRGGAILMQEELVMLKRRRGALGKHRNLGFESVTIWSIGEPCAALNLHVLLPFEYAPKFEDVHVIAEDAALEYPRETESLRGELLSSAPGSYSLRVKYPRANRDYTVRWRPIGQAEADANGDNRIETEAFVKVAEEIGGRLLGEFAAALQRVDFRFRGTLELFVRRRYEFLDRIAVLPMCDGEIPPAMHPGLFGWTVDAQNPLHRAWWGVVATASKPEDAVSAEELGFHLPEKAASCVPLRFGLDPENPFPWGVVRLGIHEFLFDSTLYRDERTVVWRLQCAVAHCMATALPEMIRKLGHEPRRI